MITVKRKVVGFVLVALVLGLCACASTPKTASQKEEARAEVRAMAKQTLEQLYKAKPEARAVVTKAAGYAVFSDVGFKLLFMGGSNGEGVAVNNATRKETFMKMVELQPGLGLGAQKFRAVFVFATREAFDKFVTSGWQFGANAMAAAKPEPTGAAASGAVTISEGVSMYQMTEEGLIAGVSITGAKYYKDDDLN